MRHSSRILRLITVVFSFLFIGLALFFPDTANNLAPWTVLISVFLIGIPHGAIDHIMAGELYGLSQTFKDHMIFYGSYLIIMLFVGALWFFYPVAGMIFFLIISIYHFGQADMEDFIVKKPGKRLFYVARGLLVIGLIIFSNTTITFAIMSDAMRSGMGSLRGLLPASEYMIVIIISAYALILIPGVLTRRLHSPMRLLLDSVLLIALLIITGPMIGFALYFALWHSAGHIREMKSYFESKNQQFTVLTFYRKSAPFTLISILGLIVLLWVNQTFGIQNELFSLLFILISVLTLPHMVIVEKMYGSARY
jgi:Brp/Blh family beta-carotene 15,15'-monooxygenase